ncbi:NUDIX hydrolase [Paracidovorax avenae]|uniref:NUDIX hydrolase n=1 Tax=Paracidovorax avenae TaxID=80867 RepID=UPI000D172E63|nr:NUDIX domain-containing protein [Paracidovorax avenae]AVS70001.1 NUDIX hydrolase [Paracidovorax avenae]
MNERLGNDGHHGVTSDLGYIVDEYLREYPSESGALLPLTEQLSRGGDITLRSASPGHVTASGIVLSHDAVLLVFHPYLKRWLQPGGHVESSEAPLDAAIREVREETGIATLAHPWHFRAGIPLDIDIHAIPENPAKGEPAHMHFDFRYLLVRDESKPILHGTENHPCRWTEIFAVSSGGLSRIGPKISRHGLAA